MAHLIKVGVCYVFTSSKCVLVRQAFVVGAEKGTTQVSMWSIPFVD
jgi:hypothetical protein